MSDRRERIAAALKASAEVTEAFFRGLPAEPFARQIYDHGGAWNLKELLAHLVSVEPSMQRLFRNLLSGGEGSPPDFDLERFNRQQPAKLAGRSVDALLERYRRQREVSLDMLRGMRDADLERRGWHVYLGEGSLADFVNWTGAHEALHLADASAVLGDGLPAIVDSGSPWRRRTELRRELRATLPTDESERAHRDAMLALTEVPGDVFARSHFSPGHFTASAFVLSENEAELLLILHGKLERWLQPGGHVDPTDQDIEAAARRELFEETGLQAVERIGATAFDLDVHQIPSLGGDPAHLHFDVRLLFKAMGSQVQAGSDAKDARWIPIVSVNPTDSDASVMRAVRKLNARVLDVGIAGAP